MNRSNPQKPPSEANKISLLAFHPIPRRPDPVACRLKSILLTILILAPAFFLPLTMASAQTDLSHRQTIITGTGLEQAYRLADSLLIENTESVWLSDSLLSRDQDYHLDGLKGWIRFNRILAVSDTIRLSYQVFPFALRGSYYHPLLTIRPEEVEKIDTLKIPSTLPETNVLETGSLRKSGTLVRGITIGSDRDLSVESGLNLQVEGRLGRNVDVLALLSDQNTPIQPEGNTATLQEIDKVLISVKSTHFDATLGDYDLQFTGPRFAGYYRKLQGARLDGHTGDDRATISGAISKGQYFSNFFNGQEGNQGPYRLTDRQGRSGILVLAGSERIYLDGVLLQRGENNDYTIEYGLGEITFTPKRLITSDSRLTVDFQYSAEAYGRDIYAAQSEAHFWEDRFGLRGTLISESDARNNPLSYVLNDASKAQLAEAGDDPTKAQVVTYDSVAVGQGEYVRDSVSWGGQEYDIFVYVGKDSTGFLNVVFSYVGTGQGDYNRIAGVTEFYYLWVGPGEGSYAPVQRLPLPERKRLADGEIWGSPTRTSQIRLEAALSDYDKNTYSTIGDNNNVGIAWQAEGNWQSSEAKTPEDFARFGLETRIREVDHRFNSIDRTQQVEYARQWNLDSTTTEEESVREAAVTVHPILPLTTRMEYGLLNKEAFGFRSERWGSDLRLAGKNLPQITARADWIRSSSDSSKQAGFWTRGQTQGSYRIWRFTPSLSYQREHKRDTTADSLRGFLFNDYGAGLNYEAGLLKLGLTQELRNDKQYRQNQLKDFSIARTSGYSAELSQWHNLSTQARYTHRVKDFQDTDSAQTRTDLLEINSAWTPWNSAVDLNAHYRVNNTRVSTIIQTPINVGPGQGTHVKVGDLYFEDPDGDYILIAQSTGQFQPVVDLEGSFSLDLDPYRLPKEAQAELPNPWRQLSSQTMFNFTEKTKERNTWALYRLDFSKFQGDSTLQGTLQLREDLFLFRHRKDLSFRLRGEISQSLSNLYLSGGQESKRRLVTLRVRRAFSEQWSVLSDLSRETDLRQYRSTSVSSHDILSYQLSVEPSFRPTKAWELALRALAQRYHDRAANILADRFGVEPRIVRTFTERGRAELRGEYHRVQTDQNTLPYEMASGDPPGDNFRWDLRLDYRISKYLTASLSYNGSKDAGRDAIHVGRAEVRAFF
ncbi:MAG: hypothetical protein NTW14_11250 [bacterium]|nr:hypothetical protein [bacterium]